MATTTTAPVTVGTAMNATHSSSRQYNMTDPWATVTAPRATLLAAFLVCGLVGNILLMVTLLTSKRLRATTFYVFLLNHAAVNICECVLNMTLLLVTTIMESWDFSEVLCHLSCFSFNLVSIETVLSLTVLASDRMIAIRYREKYDHVISPPRLALLISYTWVQAFAFSLPIAIGEVATSVDENIFYCTISAGSTVVFVSFSALFCYLVPMVLMTVFHIYILRTYFKERFVVRALLAQNSYNEDDRDEPRLQTDIRYSKLTGTLFVVWLAVEGPYVVTSYFSQVQYSSEVEPGASEDAFYTWHVDLVLLWLRFTYTIALPIVACVWSREVWRSFRDMITCKRNISLVDALRKTEKNRVKEIERKAKEEEKLKEAFAPNTVFQVPVLFATSRGVHIQHVRNEDEFSESELFDKDGNIRGKKCDVIGSRDNLNHLEEDTSDYDSGNDMDPFSVSHPISTRQLKQGQLTHHHRSSSQPEVNDRKRLEGSMTVGSTSAADSGLDLSTGTTLYRKTHSMPLDAEIHTKAECPSGQKSDSDSGVLCQTLVTTVDEQAIKPPASDAQDDTDLNGRDQCVEKSTEIVAESADTHDHMASPTRQHEVHNAVTERHQEKPAQNPIMESLQEVISSASVTHSPVPRRKKRRKKDTLSDAQNTPDHSVTSSPMLPLRPPARLAPLTGTQVKTLYTTTDGRPGSRTSFTSQSSMLDSTLDCVKNSLTDVNSCSYSLSGMLVKDSLGAKKRSKRRSSKEYSALNENTDECVNDEFSVNCGNRKTGLEAADQGDSQGGNGDGDSARPVFSLSVDCSRQMSSLTEEVISPSDCNLSSGLPLGGVNVQGQGQEQPQFTVTDSTGCKEHAVQTPLATDQYRHGNSIGRHGHSTGGQSNSSENGGSSGDTSDPCEDDTKLINR